MDTERKPIYYYVSKQAQLKGGEDVITQFKFSVPYNMYKKTELSELSKQLVDVFEKNGYFETLEMYEKLWGREPRMYKFDDWRDVQYFEGFEPYDVPFPNESNDFDDFFNISLAEGVSKREGDTEWNIGFFVNLPKVIYKNVPDKTICDNLRASFEFFIATKSTHEKIEQIYENFLKHKKNE